jgi:hypothetical protein
LTHELSPRVRAYEVGVTFPSAERHTRIPSADIRCCCGGNTPCCIFGNNLGEDAGRPGRGAVTRARPAPRSGPTSPR